MSGRAGAGEEGRSIDLTTLTVQQLSELEKRLDQEVKSLTRQHGQLKFAQERFLGSKTVLSSLDPEAAGAEVMVPLTESLYVPGTLDSSTKVMVDVGTGYFVSMDIPAAQASFIKSNADSLWTVVENKQGNLRQVGGMLKQRVEESAAARPSA